MADYILTQSINTAAKRNGVSWDSANRVLKESEELKKKLQEKKEEDEASILEYMDAHRDKVCELIDLCLTVLPEKIQNARTASEVTTALGTLIDKWTGNRQAPASSTKGDDPITKSLKEDKANGLL